jgi:hypothetical protein
VFARRFLLEELAAGTSVERFSAFGDWSPYEQRNSGLASALISTAVIDCSNCEPVMLSGFHVIPPN